MRGLTVKMRAFSICMAIQYIGVMKSGVKLVLPPTNLHYRTAIKTCDYVKISELFLVARNVRLVETLH